MLSLEVLVAQSGRLALMALLGILVAQRVALAMAVVQVVAAQAGKTAQTATLAVAAAVAAVVYSQGLAVQRLLVMV
jgi:hypothetical protein